jgi:hypothetical protein
LRFNFKRRLLYIGIGAAIFLAAYSGGAAIPLSEEEASMVRDQFAEQIEGIDAFGIFLNNFGISLAMFIPAAGGGFGGFVGFATGTVYSAIAEQTPGLTNIPPLLIFITPFGIMELFVYAMGMSRSGILIVRIAKDKPWRADQRRPFFENVLKPTFIELGIAAVVLFAAAIIEWEIIELLGGLDSTVLQPS